MSLSCSRGFLQIHTIDATEEKKRENFLFDTEKMSRFFVSFLL
jgi:hypothetical protein